MEEKKTYHELHKAEISAKKKAYYKKKKAEKGDEMKRQQKIYYQNKKQEKKNKMMMKNIAELKKLRQIDKERSVKLVDKTGKEF